MPAILKKTKAAKFLPVKLAGGTARYMTDEDIMDESEPTTVPNLSEGRKSVMNKLVGAVAFLWSFYDAKFSSLAKKHALGVGEI